MCWCRPRGRCSVRIMQTSTPSAVRPSAGSSNEMMPAGSNAIVDQCSQSSPRLSERSSTDRIGSWSFRSRRVFSWPRTAMRSVPFGSSRMPSAGIVHAKRLGVDLVAGLPAETVVGGPADPGALGALGAHEALLGLPAHVLGDALAAVKAGHEVVHQQRAVGELRDERDVGAEVFAFAATPRSW